MRHSSYNVSIINISEECSYAGHTGKGLYTAGEKTGI